MLVRAAAAGPEAATRPGRAKHTVPADVVSLRLGVEFVKRPDDGKMKGLAFVMDPDGYW